MIGSAPVRKEHKKYRYQLEVDHQHDTENDRKFPDEVVLELFHPCRHSLLKVVIHKIKSYQRFALPGEASPHQRRVCLSDDFRLSAFFCDVENFRAARAMAPAAAF